MSQSPGMMARMNTRPRPEVLPPVSLVWVHDGVLRRASPWPEVRFERQVGNTWREGDASEESLASAASIISPNAWVRYLEYVPAAERAFLGRFRVGRIAALQVLARCPEVAADLIETPALAPFLAAHQSLRGTPAGRWAEINAIHERGGIFGLLEWLGLPASRQTLAILQQITDPDLPLRFLGTLRTGLWEPETIWDLQHSPAISGRQLERFCHALAA
jgi:hypothetical protein